jgi:hypothetical protein
VPLAVTIPLSATKGDHDQVTLTITSVYSPVHTGYVVLRTVFGYECYLPLVLKSSQPPEPCTEGLANGGFEDDADWEIPSTGYPAGYTTVITHSGGRSMRVGIVQPTDNRPSYSSARQLVTIPADVISATLRFWLYPVSGEPAALDFPVGPPVAVSGDAQYVLVLDEHDQQVDTLLWQRTDDRQWTFHQFDLMYYAGQTVKLHFGVYNDGGGGVTRMYLDDVSLELCFATSSP